MKYFLLITLIVTFNSCRNKVFMSDRLKDSVILKDDSAIITETFNGSETVDCEENRTLDSCKKIARDILIVLDSTTSVSDDNWIKLIDIIREIVKRLNIGPLEFDNRFAVFEFGDTRANLSNINFLAGTKSSLSDDPDVLKISKVRQIRESSYDGLGPALVRGQEYLERVGRPYAKKEIWAIHDMTCCGFPKNGLSGRTQIGDANWVKDKGTTIIGIRTLRSSIIGDSIPTPGLAFDAGKNMSDVLSYVTNHVLKEVDKKFTKRKNAFTLKHKVNLNNTFSVYVDNEIILDENWSYDPILNAVLFENELLSKDYDLVRIDYYPLIDK